MGINAEQWAFLLDDCKLRLWAQEHGYMLTGGELKRTKEQQALYYGRGASDTMESLHLLSLAQDYNVFVNGKLTYEKEALQPLGDYWESLNPKNRWGGNFRLKNGKNDTPHFERRLRK